MQCNWESCRLWVSVQCAIVAGGNWGGGVVADHRKGHLDDIPTHSLIACWCDRRPFCIPNGKQSWDKNQLPEKKSRHAISDEGAL